MQEEVRCSLKQQLDLVRRFDRRWHRHTRPEVRCGSFGAGAQAVIIPGRVQEGGERGWLEAGEGRDQAQAAFGQRIGDQALLDYRTV